MPIEWIRNEYGSGSRAVLSPMLTISIEQMIGTRGGAEPKWMVHVFGAFMKRTPDTENAAKAMAERVARRQIALAVATLDGEETT